MKVIKWSDFKISVISDSIKRLKISDEIYFGPLYKDYISNSRLKDINPNQNGSPQLYLDGGIYENNSSLSIGSAVHQLLLQKNDFNLIEGLHKPSAKLGQVIDKIKYYRKNGLSISDAISKSSQDISYYATSLTKNRIKKIISEGLHYYLNSNNLIEQDIVLSDRETEIVKSCLQSLQSNLKITNLLEGIDIFGDQIESYNEDALFIDLKVSYKTKSTILKLKMKADNWTIDQFNQIVTLNDLKTTSHGITYFMNDGGSFDTYHYSRQLAYYLWVLKQFCKKEYKCDKSWTYNANIIGVETSYPFQEKVYAINEHKLKKGRIEFSQLLKRVAYLQLFGPVEVSFI